MVLLSRLLRPNLAVAATFNPLHPLSLIETGTSHRHLHRSAGTSLSWLSFGAAH